MYSVSFEMKVDYSDTMMDVETWIEKDGCGYGWALGEDGDGLECCLRALIA